MKILRINDAIHQQLKRDAKAQGHTLQYLVEQKLCAPSNSNHTSNASVASYKPLQEPSIVDDSQEYQEPSSSPLDALISSGLIKKGF